MFGMLSVLAELQRELIVANTHDGLAAARACGRRGGRPSKLSPAPVDLAQKLYDEGGHTVQQIADLVRVKRSTLYRHLQPTSRSSVPADEPGPDGEPDPEPTTDQAHLDALMGQLPPDTRPRPTLQAYDDLLQADRTPAGIAAGLRPHRRDEDPQRHRQDHWIALNQVHTSVLPRPIAVEHRG
jgi:hypothetical protein